MKYFGIGIILGFLSLTSCIADMSQIKNININSISPQTQPLDTATIARGLKEALNIGTDKSVDFLSAAGKFYNTTDLRILMPNDLKNLESKLRQIGLGPQVDSFIKKMNEAAEKAIPQAKSILKSAITSMTIDDARAILNGADDAATQYFKRKLDQQLYRAFYPEVKKVMDSVGVTRLYTDLETRYNSIPLVQKVHFDINDYITRKGLEALYRYIAVEERKIRTDVKARVTDLLRRVFG